ncbi:MAG TPA: ABC transporter ATP-binding protein, partial [Dehalococcoidia bacterium]
MLSVDFEKRLGDFVLRPSFAAEDDMVVLFGPSGSGKSLTLKAIAGLLTPDSGRIELSGRTVFDSEVGIDLPPQVRNVGYVVQELALFPHLSVRENLGFSLAGRPKAEREARVAELVETLGLQGFEDRLPHSISGGQQQRAALGRALAARPAVLLLDEPFSALDAPLRTALRREVAGLRRQLGLTAVLVTHDLQEAFTMADRMAVYDDGAVLQFGRRDEVFASPASVRVAELLDARNIIRGRVKAVNEAFVLVQTPAFEARARVDSTLGEGDAVAFCVRPEHVILLRRDRPHANNLDTTLDVELVDEEASGNSHRLLLKVVGSDQLLEADISAHPYEVMGVGHQREWRVA